MAKKNRDLFEILGSRAGAGAGGIVRKVQDIVAPSDARAKKGRRGKATAPAGASGVVIAAVAFGCLVTGFAVGRLSGPANLEDELNSTAGRTERRAAGAGESRFGVEPGRFGAETKVAISDEKLVESLSQFFHPLLPFSVPDTPGGERNAFEDAKRLALWMHGRGFSNVRLWRFQSAKADRWVVVDYIEDPNDKSEYEKLSKLESPDFAPKLAGFIAKFPKPFTHPDS